MKNSLGKSGAITLIALSVIAKAIGVLYRIPLFSLIGAQGVGIYQLSFSFYALLVSLVSGGVSVVVSRETSVKNAENDRVNLEKNNRRCACFVWLFRPYDCIAFVRVFAIRIRVFG